MNLKLIVKECNQKLTASLYEKKKKTFKAMKARSQMSNGECLI